MCAMNLADPELELIDPTPNIHVLFLQFDKIFFWAKLASRAVVRWSKRMYSCAGICSYDRGGLCDIALSEPLLKLRPRKDLVETLLHEMIHAFLFITCRDQDRDGHGPNFKAHMFRINKAAGVNISIYHDFHDEVKLYQTHWWRCNGPCQTKRPHFGIVRRSTNRAPGPFDYWWQDHQRRCGGDFIKVKEPEKMGKKQKVGNKTSSGDITKYISNNNNKTVADKNKPSIENITRPVLKDSNLNKPKVNNNGSLVVSKKNNIVFNPQISKPIVNSNHQTIGEKTKQTSVSDIVETVRSVWANKNLPTLSTVNKTNLSKSVPKRNSTIFDSKFDSGKSPPKKIKKIDDYFKSTATNVLKDIYGHDFNITQSTKDDKLIAMPVKIDQNVVDCPVCNIKISCDEVNKHLDECLNRDIIEKIGKDSIKLTNESVISSNNSIIEKKINVRQINDCIDLTNVPLKTIKNEDYPMTKINITKIDSKLNNIIKKEGIKKPETYVFEEIVSNTKEEKVEAGSSKMSEYNCPCCGNPLTKPIEEHFDECLAFFENNTTIPEEGASTSFSNETILIDDDDINDETLTFNATGTKSPCPCCMKMIEMADMNDHLDICLGGSFS